MGHTAPKVLSCHGTKMAHRNHTPKSLDLSQASTTAMPKQRRRSQPYTTQRSSAERMTAQHSQTTPKTKPSHVPGQPGCPPTRRQDPQLNLFMKCSGLRTRLWGRAQNGRSAKEAPKTAIQEAFFQPSCNQQRLYQRALQASVEPLHDNSLALK